MRETKGCLVTVRPKSYVGHSLQASTLPYRLNVVIQEFTQEGFIRLPWERDSSILPHDDSLNFQLNNRFLLTLILIGQPELKDLVFLTPQFEQRIAIRYHLTNLSYEEMINYIWFRLKKAGLKRNVFTAEAMEKIYEYSDGIPRKINNICDMGLLVGWSLAAEHVDSKIISTLIDENKNGQDIRYSKR